MYAIFCELRPKFQKYGLGRIGHLTLVGLQLVRIIWSMFCSAAPGPPFYQLVLSQC